MTFLEETFIYFLKHNDDFFFPLGGEDGIALPLKGKVEILDAHFGLMEKQTLRTGNPQLSNAISLLLRIGIYPIWSQ